MLGKGGKTIAALRADTHASVRVIPWEGQKPECLADLGASLEVLQIEGRQALAVAALRAATSLLRQWQVPPSSSPPLKPSTARLMCCNVLCVQRLYSISSPAKSCSKQALAVSSPNDFPRQQGEAEAKAVADAYAYDCGKGCLLHVISLQM